MPGGQDCRSSRSVQFRQHGVGVATYLDVLKYVLHPSISADDEGRALCIPSIPLDPESRDGDRSRIGDERVGETQLACPGIVLLLGISAGADDVVSVLHGFFERPLEVLRLARSAAGSGGGVEEEDDWIVPEMAMKIAEVRQHRKLLSYGDVWHSWTS